MKNLNKKDLNMGNYDFDDDAKYYQPVVVDNVIIRYITKYIKRKGNYALIYFTDSSYNGFLLGVISETPENST